METQEPVSGEVVEQHTGMIPSGGGLLLEPNSMKFGDHFEWTRTGLTIIGRPSFDVCGDMAHVLSLSETSLQFVIGDFLNWAEGVFGEKYAQLIDNDVCSWTEGTVRTYQWVAGKVAPGTRKEKLSFYHHQIVAKLNTAEEQEMWLGRALEGTNGVKWTSTHLKKMLGAAGRDIVFTPKAPKYFITIECEGVDEMQARCRQLDNLGIKYKTKVPAAQGAKELPAPKEATAEETKH